MPDIDPGVMSGSDRGERRERNRLSGVASVRCSGWAGFAPSKQRRLLSTATAHLTLAHSLTPPGPLHVRSLRSLVRFVRFVRSV